jgi:nicotinate-nucleotide pyrophosphorylase (carboxylating)
MLTEILLNMDRDPRDLTAVALGIDNETHRAAIITNEPGILAGLDEAAWLFRSFGLAVEPLMRDGNELGPGDTVLRIEGPLKTLLSLERVGLNLLQRMSGIATETRKLQNLARRQSPDTLVVATRKTPWGLLDKRAVHLGGGGTHRLGLWDAILIKSNHLRLLAGTEKDAIPIALSRAWNFRREAAFIEIEVTEQESAVAAAHTFHRLQAADSVRFPCFVMLDNLPLKDVRSIISALRSEDLWDDVLVEVSGGVSENLVGAYAESGADAISIGALTHSSRALDLRCTFESRALGHT